jgi:hypothetical protein
MAMTDWYAHISGTDTQQAARVIDEKLGGLADDVTRRIREAHFGQE